jgi:alpha-tubulin suppressor-like RCC1 family protein
MSFLKSADLKKYIEVLNNLKEEFLQEIKLLYAFKNFNLFFVTKDDKVFAFGSNDCGVLGFGNEENVNELTLNEELSNKNIIDFKNSNYCVIARTINYKIYCWGINAHGSLANGKINWKVSKPELNNYLSDKKIIDICCGYEHTIVLTNNAEVYSWGGNEWGQIGNGTHKEQSTPIKVNGFNESVVQISCGGYHSMALTESGRVFSWAII